MSTPINAGLLRHVGLNTWDINTLGILKQNGGEVRWFANSVKNPQTKEMLQGCVKKGLVELITRNEAEYLRLTDLGHLAVEQMDAMNAARGRVIVNSTGETPPE